MSTLIQMCTENAFVLDDSTKMGMFCAQIDFSMHFALFVILPWIRTSDTVAAMYISPCWWRRLLNLDSISFRITCYSFTKILYILVTQCNSLANEIPTSTNKIHTWFGRNEAECKQDGFRFKRNKGYLLNWEGSKGGWCHRCDSYLAHRNLLWKPKQFFTILRPTHLHSVWTRFLLFLKLHIW